jgi:hypothetical protein
MSTIEEGPAAYNIKLFTTVNFKKAKQPRLLIQTGHHDSQHYDIQHNDTQHNDIQHNITQYNDIQYINA